MATRRPVVLGSYRDVATGHLAVGNPARDGAVAAIPMWWPGDVIGVNVVFAGCPRPFVTADVDQLEILTQLVAPGFVTAAQRDLPLPRFLDREAHAAGAAVGGATTGRTDAASPVAEVAMELSALGERGGVYHGRHGELLHVAVVREGAACACSCQVTPVTVRRTPP